MNKDEIKRELLLNGIRWCNNILVELLSNYAASVDTDGRSHLSKAIQELSSAEMSFGTREAAKPGGE